MNSERRRQKLLVLLSVDWQTQRTCCKSREPPESNNARGGSGSALFVFLIGLRQFDLQTKLGANNKRDARLIEAGKFPLIDNTGVALAPRRCPGRWLSSLNFRSASTTVMSAGGLRNNTTRNKLLLLTQGGFFVFLSMLRVLLVTHIIL